MQLNKHHPEDYQLIRSDHYLTRYHACNRILKAYGIKQNITELRMVFHYIAAGGSENRKPSTEEQKGFEKAQQLLLQFIQNHHQTPNYEQMNKKALTEALLDECYFATPNLDKIKQLVQLGASIHDKDQHGFPAYVRGMDVKDYDNLKFFLEQGADINYQYQKSSKSEQPYFNTIFLNHLSRLPHPNLQLMLEYGAKALDKDHNKSTALHLMSKHKADPKSIQLLIEKGIAVNAQNIYGETALHLAFDSHNNQAACRALLVAGADPDIQNNKEQTAAHKAAARHNDKRLFQLLHEFKADLNIRDATGNTPLHLAAHFNKPSNAAILVELGVDTKLKNKDGLTAYAIAIDKGYVDLAKSIHEDAEKDRSLTFCVGHLQYLVLLGRYAMGLTIVRPVVWASFSRPPLRSALPKF